MINTQIQAKKKKQENHPTVLVSIAEDAKTRYVEFFNRFPTLANRIPLNYLASYIGITKNSLSRIAMS